jgi:hypothetical protein
MAERTPILRPDLGFASEVTNRSGVMAPKIHRAPVARGTDMGSDPNLAITTSDPGVGSLTLEDWSGSGGVGSGWGAFVAPVSQRPSPVTTVTGKDAVRSDEYTATLRRRRIGVTVQLIGELPRLRTDERFPFAADAAVRQIEAALQELAEAVREGNAREIFRTLLNTLRNGGWERYKEPAVAESIQKGLTRLVGGEWVTPAQAEEFLSLVDDLGLNSLTLPAEQWPE